VYRVLALAVKDYNVNEFYVSQWMYFFMNQSIVAGELDIGVE
jgi:hypothetical protein